MYTLKFVYLDGKDVDINIEDEKVGDFFERLNKGEIYWNTEEQTNGFWLNLDKIRYIQFFAGGEEVKFNFGPNADDPEDKEQSQDESPDEEGTAEEGTNNGMEN